MTQHRSFQILKAGLLFSLVLLAFVEPPESGHEELSPVSPEASSQSPSSIHVSDDELEEMSRAQEALRVLVQTHPHPDIRGDLNTLIESGQVYLNFQEHATGENSIASARFIRTPEGLILALVVSPRLLLDESRSLALKQLIVYHEYIHIRQQLSGSQPAWLATGFLIENISDEQIRTYIDAEMEAYEAECRFAEQIEATDAFALCQVYSTHGVRALRNALADNIAASPNYRSIAGRVLRIGYGS